MDPFHPLLPIQPTAPTPPDYNRVQRIERDPQGDSGPDWQGEDKHKDSDDEQSEEQFEDVYDPDWTDPATVEPYGPHGEVHDTVDLSTERELRAERDRELEQRAQRWDPRLDGERRSRPRKQGGADGAGTDDDDPPQHIDISA